MRLGVFYTIFNGTELLNGALRNIEPYVDVILLHYQTTSNRGHKSDEFIEWYQQNKDNLSDKISILRYKPRNDWRATKKNERIKHNQALEFLRKQGCTHFMMSACDHYYEPDQFRNAKEYLKENDFDVTWSSMYTYYKYPTWQLTPIENYYMPFICKILPETRICSRFPVRVDPSCGIAPYRTYKGFEPNELILHHYSMIRQDIRNKFENAAASINWRADEFVNEYENYDLKENKGVSYFQGRKIKVVPNWFNV
jgi:hypothetical protein